MDFSLLTLSPRSLILLIVLLIAFLVISIKALHIVIRLITVAILSGVFPVFAVKVLGLSLPLTLDTIIFFVACGVGLYSLYSFLKSLWLVSKVIYYIGKIIVAPFKWACDGIRRLRKKRKPNQS